MNPFRIQLQGQSMYPLIQDQQWVNVNGFSRPRPLHQFTTGQVLLLRDGGEFIVHRSLRKGNALLTKGDWSPVFDQDVLVWGEVIGIENRQHPLLQSKILSFLSRYTALENASLVRKTARLCIYLVVKTVSVFRLFL